jgi:hypothetical protein
MRNVEQRAFRGDAHLWYGVASADDAAWAIRVALGGEFGAQREEGFVGRKETMVEEDEMWKARLKMKVRGAWLTTVAGMTGARRVRSRFRGYKARCPCNLFNIVESRIIWIPQLSKS